MHSDRILSASQLVTVLAGGRDAPSERGGSVDLLSHSLQAAAEAYLMRPADDELHIAALVHDIGHLLPRVAPPAAPIDHAAVGSGAVVGLLGERVAALVALHVDARRYLAATDRDFVGSLSEDGRQTLLLDGGAFEPEEVQDFERAQYSLDALLLGRLDDFTHDAGRAVPPLTSWLACIDSITARVQRERSRSRLERLSVPS